MFTIKYRLFQPSAQQPQDGPTQYDLCEQIHGPFTLISQEMADGYPVVYAHNGDDPGMTFGPHIAVDAPSPEAVAEFERQSNLAGQGRCDPPAPLNERPPRSILWVMNESGATVATYRL